MCTCIVYMLQDMWCSESGVYVNYGCSGIAAQHVDQPKSVLGVSAQSLCPSPTTTCMYIWSTLKSYHQTQKKLPATDDAHAEGMIMEIILVVVINEWYKHHAPLGGADMYPVPLGGTCWHPVPLTPCTRPADILGQSGMMFTHKRYCIRTTSVCVLISSNILTHGCKSLHKEI